MRANSALRTSDTAHIFFPAALRYSPAQTGTWVPCIRHLCCAGSGGPSSNSAMVLHASQQVEQELDPPGLPMHQHGANLTESSNDAFLFLPVPSDRMSTAQTTAVVNRPALAGVVARVQAAVACLPVTPPGVAIVAAVASPPPAH
ncbi:hypothetical protein [uncultured Pseudomonas sp.]